jgi:mRNA interferase RelE/StbE
MAKFEIRFKKSVAKDLKSIPSSDLPAILKRIQSLSDEQKGLGVVKLSGYELYRIRQGRYRIVYEIRDTELVISVIKVAHRSVVYKNL